MEKSKSFQNKENVNKSKKSKNTLDNSSWSPEKLNNMIDKANSLLQQYKFEEACKVSDLILQKFPTSAEALELRANVAIEMSDREVALQCLDRAIAIKPFSEHSNYLSKAQLLEGKESLKCYQKAVEIIKVELNKIASPRTSQFTVGSKIQGNEEDTMECDSSAANDACSKITSGEGSTSPNVESPSSLTRELSSIYCCITELYFTDLCDEPDAEEAVKNYVQLAITADTSNPEASITKARYLNIIGDQEGAKNELESSRTLWVPPDLEKTDDLTRLEEIPPSCKLSASKLFIELEMFEDAIKMLECLLLEDDQVVETHYLLGWTSYLQKNYSLAKQYLLDAKKTEREFPCDDDGIVAHIKDLLAEVNSLDGEDMEGDGDSDSWEDEEDDEELERQIIEQAERAEREEEET